MQKNLEQLRRIALGTAIGGMMPFIAACSGQKDDNQDSDQKPKTEAVINKKTNDPYGNVARFEASRSKIKFALAFVENYYPYTYFCGKAWTTGHGLTVLYDANGNYTKVTSKTKAPSLEQSDVYKGRYLTHEVLPDIKDCFTVPVDENTMIAACVLRFCVGGSAFRKSNFVKMVNAGAKGEDLARALTGFRKQSGVLNRCYFFAALLAGKITYDDLLDLRAEGCYNLTLKQICKHNRNGNLVKDKDNFLVWDFSDMQTKLGIAKKQRTVTLTVRKNGKKTTQRVTCQNVKDIVPEYILSEIKSGTTPHAWPIAQQENVTITSDDADKLNDDAFVAYKEKKYNAAIQLGTAALNNAKNNKQRCAANYNIGCAYMGLNEYGNAVKYLEQAEKLATTDAQKNAAQQKLLTAKEESNRQKNKNLLVGAALTLAAAAAIKKRFGNKVHTKVHVRCR